MNHRITLVSLKAAGLFLLLLIFALCFFPLPVQAEDMAAAASAAEKADYLIIVPIRNQALQDADSGQVVISELLHALHILQNSQTQIAFVPLMAGSQNNPASQPVTDIRAGDTQAYEALFNSYVSRYSGDEMTKGIELTFDTVLELAKQPDRHALVLLIQAKAYAPTWTKLHELLSDTDAELTLVSVAGAEPSADISDFMLEMGLTPPDGSQTEAGTLWRLSPQVQVMEVPQDRQTSSYEAFEQVFTAASGQYRLPLAAGDAGSKVVLPDQGVSHILLILKNIPEGYDIRIVDQDGNPVSPVQQYNDTRGQQIFELADTGGTLTVAAFPPPTAEILENTETPADLPTAEPTGDAGAAAPADGSTPAPPDGAAGTPAPTPPAPEETGVEGMALFDFECGGTLSLTTEDGQTSYHKNNTIAVTVLPQGDRLTGLIQSYPDIRLQLLVTDAQAQQTAYPISLEGGGAPGYACPISLDQVGGYTLQAELLFGDFCTVGSNTLGITITNQAPTVGLAPAYDFWIDDPYQPDTPIAINVKPLFSDPDGDPLQYRIVTGGDGGYQTVWTEEGFAQLAIEDHTLVITPLATSASRDIGIQAYDSDGGSVISAIPIALHSVYDALAAVTFADDLHFSSHVAKYASVTISAEPQFPAMVGESVPVTDSFYQNAKVACLLVQTDSGITTTLPMSYDEASAAYQVVYPMPDTAVQYQVSVEFTLTMPEGDERHADLHGVTNAVALISENTAPEWVAAYPDLGEQWMINQGSGEAYDVTLDFAALFADAEDALPDTQSQLTGYVQVKNARGQALWFVPQADGAYEQVQQKKADAAGAVDVLALPNAAQATLRLRTSGAYSLLLRAVDPDELSADGLLTLRLKSPFQRLLLIIALAAAGLLLLAGLALLIAHLLKPAFGPHILQVSLHAPEIDKTWNVPLKAWKKSDVPLQWLLIYGSIPPFATMETLAYSVLIKPSRGGIQIVTRNNSLVWTRGEEPLSGKFEQTEALSPVTLRATDTTLVLSLSPISHRRPR